MSKKWFWWRALATLILVGLLIAGGVAIHYAAWSRGYAMGQLAAEGEEAAIPPYMPHSGWPFGVVPHPFGVGLLFKVVLGLLFFAVICKIIRFVIWGVAFRPMMAGPWPRHWHRAYWRRAARWHRMHGPVPPWCWGWEEPHEEQPGEVEPEADTSKAGA